MKNKIVSPNWSQTWWGIGYLLFQMTVLPFALSLIFLLLGLPLDDSRLNLVYYAVNFVALLCIFWRFLRDSLRHALEDIGNVLIPAAVCFFIYRFSSALVDLGIYYLFPDFFNVNDANIATMAQDQLPLWALATIVLVPPAEELIFRGALFGGFFTRCKALGWIVSVLGFAVVHTVGYIGQYSWDQLLICTVQYLPAGICLAAAYRKSGNIFSPMIIHAAINAIAMLSLAMM